ncbi:acyl-CoA dehydrogenase family protein [Acrocarpospora catenulata]|uniref:acyl-CoA dehydrogenase family protein n=1 Tax=Acrocarpospora catenulata TaxID=2836182 RepID=UPI001BDB12B7|nr:acyl-CoA dehydrogenase family protein [Acrocarpospora catenulata]
MTTESVDPPAVNGSRPAESRLTGVPTVSGLRAAAAPVLARLGATAREREESHDFAFDEVRRLIDTGILLLAVPAADGGAGGSQRDLFDFVIDLARADSALAQALRGSFLAGSRLSARTDFPGRAELLEQVRAGHLFSGTNNERTGGPTGTINTTLRRDGDSYLLNGEKYYSTGALYATWFGGTARDEHGNVVYFRVPVDREGVERIDDFDGIGQRLTASGTTRLTNVRVFEEELTSTDTTAQDNPWRDGSGAQLYLTAVEAGIAARVFDDAVWYVREKARPIRHSTADKSIDDHYVRRTVGEIGARAFAARSVVLLAAENWEASWRLAGAEAHTAGAESAILIAQAGVIAIESALRASELIFDVAGGSITSRTLGFDRHWRNARTVANHNSRDWKAGVAGGYFLADEVPPTILF